MSPERLAALTAATVALAVAARTARASSRSVGNPVGVLPVFLGVWGSVLLLFSVPLIEYTRTPIGAWLLIYGSILATALGCLAASRSAARVAVPVAAQELALLATIRPHRLRLVWAASAVLGVLGFAAFVYAVSSVLGLAAVFSDPQAVRQVKRDSADFQSTYGVWKLLTYFNQIAFVVWTVGLRSRMFSGRWRWVRYLGWVSLVPFVFTADRNLLALVLAWTLLLHLLWPSTVRWSRLAVRGAVCVAAAAVLLTVVGNRYGGSLADHPEIAAQVNVPSLGATVIPYLYLTGNLPTFGKLTQDALAPRTDGQMSILPLVKAAARTGALATPPVETGVFYPIPFESFSNYSWLGSFWLDFRAPGVLVLSALLGFLATVARLRLARAPSFGWLWTASLLLYVIAFSPFANALSATPPWQHLLLGPIVAMGVHPAGVRGVRSRLRVLRRRTVLVGLSLAAAGLVGPALVSSRHQARPAEDLAAELRQAVAKARYVYAVEGRYPAPLGLSTRLQVNRPDLVFRPQSSYFDPVPPPGVIVVFTTPYDVYLRVREADGRVFEVHRTEAEGGVTYGPGTRDT